MDPIPTFCLAFALTQRFEWSFTLAAVDRPILSADFLRHHPLEVSLSRHLLVSVNGEVSLMSSSSHSRGSGWPFAGGRWLHTFFYSCGLFYWLANQLSSLRNFYFMFWGPSHADLGSWRSVYLISVDPFLSLGVDHVTTTAYILRPMAWSSACTGGG